MNDVDAKDFAVAIGAAQEIQTEVHVELSFYGLAKLEFECVCKRSFCEFFATPAVGIVEVPEIFK